MTTRYIAAPFLRLGSVRKLAMRDIAEHADRMTHGEAVSAMRDLVDYPRRSTASSLGNDYPMLSFAFFPPWGTFP